MLKHQRERERERERERAILLSDTNTGKEGKR